MSESTELFEDALKHCLESVCRMTGWLAGHAYLPTEDAAGELVSMVWHAPESDDWDALLAASASRRLERGQDLPGRILASGEPEWVSDVHVAEDYPRAALCRKVDVVGSCGFPIIIGGEVVAVLEFFSREYVELGDAMLHIMRSVGLQVGHVLERKRAREQREVLQERLYQAQKIEAMGQLAGGVAHDFNNVLTIIRGALDQALAVLPPRHRALEAMKTIEQASTEAVGVTQALLTFSREMPAARGPLDLVDFLTEASSLLKHLLPDAVELTLRVPETALWVLADGTKLQQILLNLAINARDAMPEGGELLIELSGLTAEDGAPLVCLEISDNGVGMAPELVERIFDPFFTTKERGKGTGLGLAIVGAIVREHGGEIDLDSEPGKGTTVRVTIARMQPPLEKPPPPEQLPPKRSRGGRVLLAEDHLQVRAIMSSALQSFGFEVLKAVDGMAAMDHQRLYGDTICLMVLDIDLPKLSGLRCLRRFRKKGVKTPVILITGNVARINEDALGENTVLLRKPFQMEQLGRVASELLEQVQDVQK